MQNTDPERFHTPDGNDRDHESEYDSTGAISRYPRLRGLGGHSDIEGDPAVPLLRKDPSEPLGPERAVKIPLLMREEKNSIDMDFGNDSVTPAQPRPWKYKRISRRKRRKDPFDQFGFAISEKKRTSSFCISKQFDEMLVLSLFSVDHSRLCQFSNPKVINEEVIHARKFGGSLVDDSDVFIFLSLGTLICWGLDEYEELAIVNELKKISVPYDIQETDGFLYAYASNDQDHIKEMLIPEGQLFIFPTGNSELDKNQKLACAYAFATSVKLGIVEEQVDKVIDDTEHIPMELAMQGRVITFNKHQVSCKIGELFMYKASINLIHEILDTPDFFWDYPQLEDIYRKCRVATDIDKRVEVLNQRMEILSELLEILQSEKNDQHSKTLEWIVIWLIIIEVIIGATDIIVQITLSKS